jgi:uncharacterized protein YjbJ (UPF0337 family)
MRTAFPSIRASIRTAVAHPTHPVKQPLCDPSYAFARTNSDGKAATRTYLGTEARTRGADRSFAMNDDRIEGNWKQFKGKVKEQWGKLTDDDLDVIAGRRDQLAGKIQERHGVARDEAERQIKDFETRNPDNRWR